jgi:serralysin
MASPTANSLRTTDFDSASTGLGKYVSAGVKWGNGLGAGTTITYSFISTSSSHVSGYGNGEFGGLSNLSTADKAAARAALAAWASVANLKFVEVADNRTTVGELRFGLSTAMDAGEAAHAYYPGDYVEAGDVWLNRGNWNAGHASTIAPGTFDFHTLLHEIGHALGLKHSFEAPNAIPSSFDSYLYTVMSYTASPWSDQYDSYSSFAPTTPMYYDLLAVQAMYGRATSVNPSNNTYTFVDGTQYWQTINDTGGVDTIVYSGSESSRINLNPGQLSAVSEAIEFDNGAKTRATVTIAPNVVIENATGGSGNDTLIGNAANNILNGGAGNDTLSGGLGNDTLTGGNGMDYFVFNTALNASTNGDGIRDFSAVDDTIRLENAIFTHLASTGALSSAFFHLGTSAADANDYIVYNKSGGQLYYDRDGNGAAAAVQFATITNHAALTYADFVII